jgi:Rrf2 family nitric oxide-sensitive transcriptional repressor
MQLTQFTDYSLRTLMYLAEHPDKLCTIGKIAEWYGISKPHLVKVVHNLAKLGYIKSVQGKGGGISLNKPVSEINIGSIVRDTEPNFHMVECFDKKNNTCKITNNCKLKHVLHDATQSFLGMLDEHTLESVCSNSKPKP